MDNIQKQSSRKQSIINEMILGTLVYSVVLGFFNDYTSILDTRSYSITFLAALVLQILTYVTFMAKEKITLRFKPKTSSWNKAAMFVSVWLVLFFSKFIFLAVIDFVFGDTVEISSFFGLAVIIIAMTVLKQLIDYSTYGFTTEKSLGHRSNK